MCVTDEQYEAWRTVRLAVETDSRCLSVEEMRELDSPERLLLVAVVDGDVVGSGIADRSDTAGAGFVAPRVLTEHRRRGVGTALLRALAEHCRGLGVPRVVTGVDDEGSLAFAERFGFAEVDREVEQVRRLGDEPAPTGPPAGVEVLVASERPDLWAACYETFGEEVLADFAVYSPLEISAEQWTTTWYGDPMFLALHDGEVIGCAGLDRDDDRPGHARERADRGSPHLAGPRHRLIPQAPDLALGCSERAGGDLHLDAGRQLLDAAPQRAPRVRHRSHQHHGLPDASAHPLTGGSGGAACSLERF